MTVLYLTDGPEAADIDDQAGKLLSAIAAVIEFGRDNAIDSNRFASATAKALIYAQAALIAVPASEPHEVELALSSHDVALRAAVADFRGGARG